MIEFVWTLTIVLGCIAALDRRAWPMLSVIALGVFQMLLSEIVLEDILHEVAMKAPIDFVAGLLALAVVRKERWSLAVPALFAVTLLLHATYWLAYWNGVDLWLWYAHSLNLTFIAQMLAVATPGGGQLVGIVRTWLGATVTRRRGNPVHVLEAYCEAEDERGTNRPPHVRAGSDVFLPPEARA